MLLHTNTHGYVDHTHTQSRCIIWTRYRVKEVTPRSASTGPLLVTLCFGNVFARIGRPRAEAAAGAIIADSSGSFQRTVLNARTAALCVKGELNPDTIHHHKCTRIVARRYIAPPPPNPLRRPQPPAGARATEFRHSAAHCNCRRCACRVKPSYLHCNAHIRVCCACRGVRTYALVECCVR